MVFPIISIGKEEINTISLILEYFGSHMGDYLTVLREHVVISLMALAISVLLEYPQDMSVSALQSWKNGWLGRFRPCVSFPAWRS